MNADRRAFLQKAGLASLGLGLRGTLTAAALPVLPTEPAKAFLAKFGLKFPIMQSGMGNLAPPALAAAVSNAGGLGSIGLSSMAPERVRELVQQTRAATSRCFAVNYILAGHDVSSLPVAVEAGAPVVQFSWGLPSREQVRLISGAGAKWGVQLSCGAAAARAVDLGADFLICQGTEAGGHVQALRSGAEALPEVLGAAASTSVLAAGGIADGKGVRRALVAGAAGVFIGTRFIATPEAYAHDAYKAALLRAKAGDAGYTICFQDGWPNAPHRALRNRTMELWEAAGCPPPGQRPGEGEVIGLSTSGAKVLRYSTTPPRPGYTGRVTEMAMWAGTGAGLIRDLPPAADLVKRLWAKCVSA